MEDNAVSLQPPRRLFLVVAAYLALIVDDDGPGVQACSMPVGWRPLTAVERVINAPMVLYGRVRTVYPYDQPGNRRRI